MTATVADIVSGETYHRRLSEPANAFRYGVDYVLVDPDRMPALSLFSADRFNLYAVHRRDHGGPRGNGRGSAWARDVLAREGWTGSPPSRLLLLTQPRFIGYWFCPVSFWLAWSGSDLRAVIAEVNNTFGDRHSYLCAHPDFRPIRPSDTLEARKVFHVSPFQDIAGAYRFRFDITDDAVNIGIRHRVDGGGFVATLSGPRRPLTSAALLGAALRRPFGALRVIGLIHWQALRLALKGARYRQRPAAPAQEVSR